jgi:hypothetical protein
MKRRSSVMSVSLTVRTSPAPPIFNNVSPGARSPAAYAETTWSAHPAVTGVPSRRPVAAAASAETPPARSRLLMIVGRRSARTPDGANSDASHPPPRRAKPLSSAQFSSDTATSVSLATMNPYDPRIPVARATTSGR